MYFLDEEQAWGKGVTCQKSNGLSVAAPSLASARPCFQVHVLSPAPGCFPGSSRRGLGSSRRGLVISQPGRWDLVGLRMRVSSGSSGRMRDHRITAQHGQTRSCSHPVSLFPFFCRQKPQKGTIYLQQPRNQECQVFPYEKGKGPIPGSVSGWFLLGMKSVFFLGWGGLLRGGSWAPVWGLCRNIAEFSFSRILKYFNHARIPPTTLGRAE